MIRTSFMCTLGYFCAFVNAMLKTLTSVRVHAFLFIDLMLRNNFLICLIVTKIKWHPNPEIIQKQFLLQCLNFTILSL